MSIASLCLYEIVDIMPKGKESLKVVSGKDLGSSRQDGSTGAKPTLSLSVHEPTGALLGQAQVPLPSPSSSFEASFLDVPVKSPANHDFFC